MRFSGLVINVGHGMNTDLIFPSAAVGGMAALAHDSAPYRAALRQYAFHNAAIDLDALRNAQFIVGGRGTGAGSSRQFAAESIRELGIRGVIADSIHPVFYRTLWNIGLFAIEVDGIGDSIDTGAHIDVNLATGILECTERGRSWQSKHIVPQWFCEIVRYGGLLPFLEGRADGGGNVW